MSGSAPFLKWAGGKRRLVARILRHVPDRVGTYYEPFVGGGAVFFALAGESKRRFERAVLGDANPELVACYAAIKKDVDAVIGELSHYHYDRDFYYEVRERNPRRMSAPAVAARLIYLNRCGYNGLYRVNSSGGFNVPFGRYKNPVICDVPKLKAAARALTDVDIEGGDFEKTLASASSRDFVYLDPPYVPLSRTSSFTKYAEKGFDLAEQQRLAQLLRALGQSQVPALLSNSDCPTTRALYDGLSFQKVLVGRAINSVAKKRGRVAELLVKSFEFSRRPKAKGRERRALSASAAGQARLTPPTPTPRTPLRLPDPSET